MKKYKFKVSGMHCTSCAMMIESEAEDLNGVQDAICNYATSLLEINCEDNFNVDNVIDLLEEKGYKGLLHE